MRTAMIALALVWLSGCDDSNVSRRVGARCDTSNDCDDRCLASGILYPGGFCTATCSDAGDCPDRAACAVIGSDADPDAVCLFRCDGDGDCMFLGEDWHCRQLDRAGGGNKVAVCG